MKKNIGIIFSLLLALPVMAENVDMQQYSDDTAGSGIYIGGKGGWVKYQHACESRALKCNDGDWAWGAFGGYQINKNWAMEFGYDKFGGVHATYKNNNERIGSAQAWELSLKRNIKITSTFDLFAKAGVDRWDVENRSSRDTLADSGFSGMLSTGVEYHISPSWVARAEYQYFDAVGSEKTGGTNLHVATLGLVYLFDQQKAPVVIVVKEKTPEKIIIKEKTVEKVIVEKIVPAEKIVKIKNAAFKSGSAELLSNEGLDLVANKLTKNPNDAIVIIGYTDSRGTKAYNLKFSKARAKAVAKEVIRLGAKKEQITTKGLGETHFIKNNKTRKNRAANRRVEIAFDSDKK